MLDTGEELLVAALGDGSLLAQAAIAVEPFVVPYDQLARIAGWVLWRDDLPAPSGVPLLPLPERLLTGDPLAALGAAAAVSADYAARRGARDATAMTSLLRVEGPVAVVFPGPVPAELAPARNDLLRLGIPVIDNANGVDQALETLPAFAVRAAAHAALVGRLHDPALSFQQITVQERIGGNSLSSFIVHHEGERDGVRIIGTFSPRFGLEIGLRGQGITLERTAELESQAALIPSFLEGVTSRLAGHSLEIGWRAGAAPTPAEIGGVLHAWLKALYGAEIVDVRLAFAPPRGRSALLTEMRARANAFREIRAAALAGQAEPDMIVHHDDSETLDR
ncbi:MAG: hypothetical protein KatS3mg059_0877 [Thermomicrobiales bacterium]|nr:MAG: hypothetical protein KatS3mg059_0877 [Thermomicrobiales bacterium]